MILGSNWELDPNFAALYFATGGRTANNITRVSAEEKLMPSGSLPSRCAGKKMWGIDASLTEYFTRHFTEMLSQRCKSKLVYVTAALSTTSRKDLCTRLCRWWEAGGKMYNWLFQFDLYIKIIDNSRYWFYLTSQ